MFLIFLLSYTIPLDSPLMENIEYLQIRGLINIPHFRPYEMEWIIPQIDELLVNGKQMNENDRKIISSFTPLLTKNQDFSYLLHLNGSYQNTPELYYLFLDYRGGGRLTNSIEYSHGIRCRRSSVIDSLGPKEWKGFQVYFPQGEITFKKNEVAFNIGRRNFLLGFNDDNDLLLSADPRGYDGFSLFFPAGYFEFYNIFSVLDASQNRYLTIHRLGMNLKNFINLGFSEALLFGGTLEPLYLNFLLPYYLTQWGTARDDNVLWCFDVRLRLWNSFLYGELLVDDYMYEDDPYPDKLGYKAGLKTIFFSTLVTKFSYTFVDKWVYTQRHSVNTYERNGVCLGYPLGNDVDNISFSVRFVNKFRLYPGIKIEYTRKGEGSIFLPYEEEGGDWNPPFPSGIVEKKFRMKTGVDYILKYNFYLSIDINKTYWRNYNHEPGNDRSEFSFNFSLWAVF